MWRYSPVKLVGREAALLSESKPRRADAVRNEGKIIEAALTQFFKQGVETSLDGIAREAGAAGRMRPVAFLRAASKRLAMSAGLCGGRRGDDRL
jgi:hypothetical protein